MIAMPLRVPFDRAVWHSNPFPHITTGRFFTNDVANEILTWLEGAAWGFRSVNDFYETFDLDFRRCNLPNKLRFLVEAEWLEDLRAYLQDQFSVQLDDRVDVTAQKMVQGQRIGLHTDYGSTGQSHRLLVQLNRGWSLENGGLLMLFDEEFPQDVRPGHRYYLPQHDSSVAFEISPRSFHGVSSVVKGTRYTVCFSFRADPYFPKLQSGS